MALAYKVNWVQFVFLVAMTEDMVTTNSPLTIHPSGGTSFLNTLEENTSHRRHTLPAPSYEKSILFLIRYRRNNSHTAHPTHQNELSHTHVWPNNRHRKWISCRSVCASQHGFTPWYAEIDVVEDWRCPDTLTCSFTPRRDDAWVTLTLWCAYSIEQGRVIHRGIKTVGREPSWFRHH